MKEKIIVQEDDLNGGWKDIDKIKRKSSIVEWKNKLGEPKNIRIYIKWTGVSDFTIEKLILDGGGITNEIIGKDQSNLPIQLYQPKFNLKDRKGKIIIIHDLSKEYGKNLALTIVDENSITFYFMPKIIQPNKSYKIKSVVKHG